MSTKFELEFGCLCKPISEQLAEHGIKLNDDKTKEFDGDMEALNMIKLKHLFPPSQIDAAYLKLGTKVRDHLYGK